jgi:hypothetical protein
MDPLHLIVQGVLLLSASMYPIALFMGSSCFCTECDSCDDGNFVRCMRLKRWYEPSTFSIDYEGTTGYNNGFWISTSFPVAFTRPTQNFSSYVLIGKHNRGGANNASYGLARRINYRDIYWVGGYTDSDDVAYAKDGHIGVSDFFRKHWVQPDSNFTDDIGSSRYDEYQLRPAHYGSDEETRDRLAIGRDAYGSVPDYRNVPLPLSISTGCLDTDRRTFKIDQVFGANWNTLSGGEEQSYKLDWVLCQGFQRPWGDAMWDSVFTKPEYYAVRTPPRDTENASYYYQDPPFFATRETLGKSYHIEKVANHWTVKLKGWDFAPHPIGYINKNYEIDWTILKVDGSSTRDNAESVFPLNFKGLSMGRSLAAPIELEVVGVQVVNNSRKGRIFATFGDGTKSVAESLKDSISFRRTGADAGYEEETFVGENYSESDEVLEYRISTGRPYGYKAKYWVGQLPMHTTLNPKPHPDTVAQWNDDTYVRPEPWLKTDEQYVDGKVRVDPEVVFPSDFDYSSTSENKRIFRYSVLEDEQEEINFTIRYTLKVSVGENSTHWLLDYNDTIGSSDIEEYDPEQDSVQPILVEGQDIVTPPDRPVEQEPPEPFVDYDARVATIYPRPSAFFIDPQYARDIPKTYLLKNNIWDYNRTPYGKMPLDRDSARVKMLEKTGDPVVKIEGVSCSQSKIKVFASSLSQGVSPAFSRNYYTSPYITEDEASSWGSGGNFRNFHNAGHWVDAWSVSQEGNDIWARLPYGDVVSSPYSFNTSNFDSGTPAYRPAIECPVDLYTERSPYVTTNSDGSADTDYEEDAHFLDLTYDGMNYPGVFAEVATMYDFNASLALHNTSMVSAGWSDTYRDQDAINNFAFNGQWTDFYSLYDGGIVQAKIEGYSYLCGHNIDQAPESTLPASLTIDPVRYRQKWERVGGRSGTWTPVGPEYTTPMFPSPLTLKRAGSTLVNFDNDIYGGTFHHFLDFPPYTTDALSFLEGSWTGTYTSGENRILRLYAADFSDGSARFFADYYQRYIQSRFFFNNNDYYYNDYMGYGPLSRDIRYHTVNGLDEDVTPLIHYEGTELSMSVGSSNTAGVSNNSPSTYGTLADLIPFFDGMDPNVHPLFDMLYLFEHATGHLHRILSDNRYSNYIDVDWGTLSDTEDGGFGMSAGSTWMLRQFLWRIGYGQEIPRGFATPDADTGIAKINYRGLEVKPYTPDDIWFMWKEYIGLTTNPVDWFAIKYKMLNLTFQSETGTVEGVTTYYDVMEVVLDHPAISYYNGPTRPAYQTKSWVNTTYEGPFESFGMSFTPPTWVGQEYTEPLWIVNTGIKSSGYDNYGANFNFLEPRRSFVNTCGNRNFASPDAYGNAEFISASFSLTRKWKYLTEFSAFKHLKPHLTDEFIAQVIAGPGFGIPTSQHWLTVIPTQEEIDSGAVSPLTGTYTELGGFNQGHYSLVPYFTPTFWGGQVTYTLDDLCELQQWRESIRRNFEDVLVTYTTWVSGGSVGSFGELPCYLTPFGEGTSLGDDWRLVAVAGTGGSTDFVVGYSIRRNGWNIGLPLCSEVSEDDGDGSGGGSVTGGDTQGGDGTGAGDNTVTGGDATGGNDTVAGGNNNNDNGVVADCCIPDVTKQNDNRYYQFVDDNGNPMYPSDWPQYEPCGDVPVPPEGQTVGGIGWTQVVPCPTPPDNTGHWELVESYSDVKLIAPGTIESGRASFAFSHEVTDEKTTLPIPERSDSCQSNYQTSSHGMTCGSTVLNMPFSLEDANHHRGWDGKDDGLHPINTHTVDLSEDGSIPSWVRERDHAFPVLTLLDSDNIESMKNFVRGLKSYGPCFPPMHTSAPSFLTANTIPFQGPEDTIWGWTPFSRSYYNTIATTSDYSDSSYFGDHRLYDDDSLYLVNTRSTRACLPVDLTTKGVPLGSYPSVSYVPGRVWQPVITSGVATQIIVPHNGSPSATTCFGKFGQTDDIPIFLDVCRSFYHNSKNGNLKKDIDNISTLLTQNASYGLVDGIGDDGEGHYYLKQYEERERLTYNHWLSPNGTFSETVAPYRFWQHTDFGYGSYSSQILRHSMQVLGKVVISASRFFNRFRHAEIFSTALTSQASPDNAPLRMYSGTYGIKGNLFLTGQPNTTVTIYLVPSQWMTQLNHRHTSNVNQGGTLPHYYDNIPTQFETDNYLGLGTRPLTFDRSNVQIWDLNDINYQQQPRILNAGTFTFDSNGQVNCLIDLPRSENFEIPSGSYLPCVYTSKYARVPYAYYSRVHDHIYHANNYPDLEPWLLRQSTYPGAGYEAQGTVCDSNNYGSSYTLIPLSSSISGVQSVGTEEASEFPPIFMTREEELIPSFNLTGPDVNKIDKSFETFDTPHGITIRRELEDEQDKYISTGVGGFKIEAYPKHPDGWSRYFSVSSIMGKPVFSRKFGDKRAIPSKEEYDAVSDFRNGVLYREPFSWNYVPYEPKHLPYSAHFHGGADNNYRHTYEKLPAQDGLLSVEIASFNIDETTTPPSQVLDSNGVHEKGITWFLSARSHSEYCKFPSITVSGVVKTPFRGFRSAEKGDGPYLEHEEEPLGLIDFTKDNNPEGLSSNSMLARGVLVAQIGRFNTTGRRVTKEMEILQHEGVHEKPERIYQGLAECSPGTNLEFFGDGDIESGKILQLKVRATDHHGGSSDWTYLADVKIDKEVPHIQQVFIDGSLQPQPEEGQEVPSEDRVTVSEQSPVDPLKFNELFPHAATEIDRDKQIPKVMLFNRLDLQLPLKLYGYTKPDTEIYTGRARRITGEECGEKLCTSDGTTDFDQGSTGTGLFEYEPEAHNTEKDWLTVMVPPDPDVEGSVETVGLNIPSNGSYKSYSFVSVSFAGAFTEKIITLLHKDPSWVSATVEGGVASVQIKNCQLGSDVTVDIWDLTGGNGVTPDYTKTIKGNGVGNTTVSIPVFCSKVLTTLSAKMTAMIFPEPSPNEGDDPGTYFSIRNIIPEGLNPSVGDEIFNSGIVDENGDEVEEVTIAGYDQVNGLYIMSHPLAGSAGVEIVPQTATRVAATGKSPPDCPFLAGQIVEGTGHGYDVSVTQVDEDYPEILTLSDPLLDSSESYFVTLRREYSVDVYVKIAGTQVWTVSKGADDVQVL